MRTKIAVFCDGDFWHGHNWAIRGLNSLEDELSRYNSFWREKIERNIPRDKKVTQTLEKERWLVLRYWESDIKESPAKCALRVKAVYDVSRGK